MGLAACTAANPAFEDDGGGSPPGPTSTTDVVGPGSTPADDPPVGTETVGGSTVTTSSGGNDGVDVADEAGTTEEPEDEEPPMVGPYGEPERLSINHQDFEDDDPTLTQDQLELYFASERNGFGNSDIWVARRESVTDDWDAPEEVTDLNSVARENTPEISRDGQIMFFSSTRGFLPAEDVFVSMRRGGMSWSEPVPVDEINTRTRDVCPFVLPNGLDMFACTGPEVDLDLVHFERGHTDGEWSAGSISLSGLNTPGDLDCGAWVDSSARVLVYFSDRPGGLGGTDLWVASRDTVDEGFGDPEPVEELNSLWLDDDPWLSQSGDVIYFASDRGGMHPQDIYMARRLGG